VECAEVSDESVPWGQLAGLVLVACVVLALLLLGPRLLLLRDSSPTAMEVSFDGQSRELPLDPAMTRGVPVYTAADPFEATLRPLIGEVEGAVLTVAAIDPLGHPVVLGANAGMDAAAADGGFVARGHAEELFGGIPGSWRLVFVVGPGVDDGAWMVANAWEIKARPDGSSGWPGGRRIEIRPVVYEAPGEPSP
jgi:hypothetical protein